MAFDIVNNSRLLPKAKMVMESHIRSLKHATYALVAGRCAFDEIFLADDGSALH